MLFDSMQFARDIIERLKSQGLFDRIRKHCLEDIDLDEDYKALQQNVNTFVSDFLQNQIKPADSEKLRLREQLRIDLCNTNMITTGVDRIVKSAVRTKLPRDFQDQIRAVVCESLGIKEKDNQYSDQSVFPNASRAEQTRLHPLSSTFSPASTTIQSSFSSHISLNPDHDSMRQLSTNNRPPYQVNFAPIPPVPPPVPSLSGSRPSIRTPSAPTPLGLPPSLPVPSTPRGSIPPHPVPLLPSLPPIPPAPPHLPCTRTFLPHYGVPPPGIHLSYNPQTGITRPGSVGTLSSIPNIGLPPISAPYPDMPAQPPFVTSTQKVVHPSEPVHPAGSTQCDDPMDIESSGSASPVAETENEPKFITQEEPFKLSDYASRNRGRDSPEAQLHSNQVVWRGVRLELDDVSDEEVNDYVTRSRKDASLHACPTDSGSRTSPVVSQLKEYFRAHRRDIEKHVDPVATKCSSDEEYVPDLLSETNGQDFFPKGKPAFDDPGGPVRGSLSPSSFLTRSKQRLLHRQKPDHRHHRSPSNSPTSSASSCSTSQRYDMIDSPVGYVHPRARTDRYQLSSSDEYVDSHTSKYVSRTASSPHPEQIAHKSESRRAATDHSKERFMFSNQESRALQVYSDVDSPDTLSSSAKKSPTLNTSTDSSSSECSDVKLRKRAIKARLQQIRFAERHLKDDVLSTTAGRTSVGRSQFEHKRLECGSRRHSKQHRTRRSKRSPSPAETTVRHHHYSHRSVRN